MLSNELDTDRRSFVRTFETKEDELLLGYLLFVYNFDLLIGDPRGVGGPVVGCGKSCGDDNLDEDVSPWWRDEGRMVVSVILQSAHVAARKVIRAPIGCPLDDDF